MKNLGIRQAGYFSSRFTIIPAETTQCFGSQRGILSRAQLPSPNSPDKSQQEEPPATSSSTAPNNNSGNRHDARYVCSEHPTGKSPNHPLSRAERESGERREVRKFSFPMRHSDGAIEDDANSFAWMCLDECFPQLRLWTALQEAVSIEKMPFRLQNVLDVWVEVESSKSVPTSPLLDAAEKPSSPTPTTYAQRIARRQLGIDDDEDYDEGVFSPGRQQEAEINAYVVLEMVVQPSIRALQAIKEEQTESTRQPLANSVQGVSTRALWDTHELRSVLVQLTQFARMSTQFTRKGNRRKGSEPTMMLDIDENNVFADVALSNLEGIARVQTLIFSIETIATWCKLRDNRYVQSPSIALIQHDFDTSLWNRVRFPTAAPLGGTPTTSSLAATPGPTTLMTGVKTTMFLVGLLLVKLAMKEGTDLLSIRVAPGNNKPQFLVDDDGKLRHDSTFRAVLLQLIDGEDANRPGPPQVLEAMREEGGGTVRSRSMSTTSGSPLQRKNSEVGMNQRSVMTPSQSGGISRKESLLVMQRTPSPPTGHRTSIVNISTRGPKPPSTSSSASSNRPPQQQASQIVAAPSGETDSGTAGHTETTKTPKGATAEDRALHKLLIETSQKYIKMRNLGGGALSPRRAGVPEPKSERTPSSDESLALKKIAQCLSTETKCEQTQRQIIRQVLDATVASDAASVEERRMMLASSQSQRRQDCVFPPISPRPTTRGGNSSVPLSRSGRKPAGLPATGAMRAQQQQQQQTPPSSSSSATRKTAETAANDDRPSPKRHHFAQASEFAPVSSVFEL